MNRLTWICIIAWGVFVTAFGLNGVGSGAAGEGVSPQDVMFLLAGGIVSCLIGVVGLLGFMGWIPGLRIDQKNYS
jgi:uncharacterized membrane protein